MSSKEEKVGALCVGINGNNATTVIASAALAAIGEAFPRYGMLTEAPQFCRFQLVPLENIVFGGWDIRPGNAFTAAIENGVISKDLCYKIRERMEKIAAMPGILGAYDYRWPEVLRFARTVNSLAEATKILTRDIQSFRKQAGIDNIVVVNLSSVEKWYDLGSLPCEADSFLLEADAKTRSSVPSSLAYAIAAIQSGCAYVDYTSNSALMYPGVISLAERKTVPVAGQDGNTGQTLLKTVIAHMLHARNLRVTGWYSTNILGNRDGEVLDHPDHAKRKMRDKVGVLEPILDYGDFPHRVDISFYAPRGDNKEAWDVVDFMGWLGTGMSLKLDWQGCDAILAAPSIFDLIRLMHKALLEKKAGVQPQLSLFFKHPIGNKKTSFIENHRAFVEYYDTASL